MKKILKHLLFVVSFFACLCFLTQPASAQKYGPEQKISIEQNFPPAVRPGGEFMMEIKIKKGNVTGLAKFQQFIPPGMTATAVASAGADFSFEAQNVKFIWTSVPQSAEITLKYRISVTTALKGKKYLSGTFSYVENDRTKKTSLVPKEIDLTPDAPATEVAIAETKPPQEEVQPEKKEAPSSSKIEDEFEKEEKAEPAPATVPPAAAAPEEAVTKKQAEEPKPVETVAPSSAVSEKKEPMKESPAPVAAPAKTGVVFKVQIAAMNEKHFRRKNYFQEKFGLQMEVAAEEHEGLKKYTVGNFTSYSQARKLRDEILSNVSDSFVVAYKDGVRIPVSEAMGLIK